ncbi:MAG: NADPH-dependent assimilatory sulfite reductase hemoprotein subunit [bacterium]|nr:NADPH-dependent assimilatory sulfite reductase hemoprotein subunit [bacterium]
MSVEDIKRNSQGLRGKIAETLASDAPLFEENEFQLLKFHGTYQQDDRDQRVQLRKEGKDRYHMFMVRSKIPGGMVTARQYIVHDEMADRFGNGTLRITSRQGLQTHFVLKGKLKDCIKTINECGLTTWGACGDVVRNVMASPVPLKTPAHEDMWALSRELADVFTAHSHAYSDIWLNGEKLGLGPTYESEEEPIYKDVYLPRKFKFGIAVPPRNDVDVYTQDLGLVPHVEDGAVAGYTLIAGGGMGMSHGKSNTHPSLGKPLFYVDRAHVVDACVAVVGVQRDHGNREDRKQARMKYLIEKQGIEWMRKETIARMPKEAAVSDPKPIAWSTTGDPLGWNEQGDGKLFLGLWIPEGRIKDLEEAKYRTGLREIAETFGFPIRFTPNCNILFTDIEPGQKDEVDALLKKHGIPSHETMSEARLLGMACVALPTCGLALADSERVFQELLDEIDVHLRELNLDGEPLLFRMTGCPNGCARPYNADFAFVGKSPGKYAVFVGGSHRGERLGRLERKMVGLDDIPALVRAYLDEYVASREEGELFSDWWGRTRNYTAPSFEQFHEESAAAV